MIKKKRIRLTGKEEGYNKEKEKGKGKKKEKERERERERETLRIRQVTKLKLR